MVETNPRLKGSTLSLAEPIRRQHSTPRRTVSLDEMGGPRTHCPPSRMESASAMPAFWKLFQLEGSPWMWLKRHPFTRRSGIPGGTSWLTTLTTVPSTAYSDNPAGMADGDGRGEQGYNALPHKICFLQLGGAAQPGLCMTTVPSLAATCRGSGGAHLAASIAHARGQAGPHKKTGTQAVRAAADGQPAERQLASLQNLKVLMQCILQGVLPRMPPAVVCQVLWHAQAGCRAAGQ